MREIAAKIITPQDRIVTANVIIAVVGATTVQLGALAITMGKYLFPKQKPENSHSSGPR